MASPVRRSPVQSDPLPLNPRLARAFKHAPSAAPDSVRERIALWDHARSSFTTILVQLLGELDALVHDLPEDLRSQLRPTKTVSARVNSLSRLDTSAVTDPTVALRLRLIGHRVAMLRDDLEQDKVATASSPSWSTRRKSTLTELVGIAPRAAAEIIVEVGDIRRFTETGLARVNGTAPIPASSGSVDSSGVQAALTDRWAQAPGTEILDLRARDHGRRCYSGAEPQEAGPHMDAAERLARYARLVVRVGANVQPGQDVFVLADVSHVSVARATAEQAYAAGARRVVVTYTDQHVRRSEILHAPDEALRSPFRYEIEQLLEFRERRAALISLTGIPEPHLFDDLDMNRVAARRRELDEAGITTIRSGDVTWTIAAAPNPGWAELVFGEPDVERLWAAVSVAMRLDQPDAVAAWRDHIAALRSRRVALDALHLDSVHFSGEGTDLRVGLIRNSTWVSPPATTNAGVEFVPNMPTEEVFTSPDFRRTEGIARVTAPLVLAGGSLVTGLRLSFEGGRIVHVEADVGADLVRAQLEEDEQAPYLGEVALVDGSSPVAQAGVLFHDTLFDENANSHIAWGRGFEMALSGSADLDRDARLAAGLNQSTIHTDVVIGGPMVTIDGVGRDGRVRPIIRNDRWILPAGDAPAPA